MGVGRRSQRREGRTLLRQTQPLLLRAGRAHDEEERAAAIDVFILDLLCTLIPLFNPFKPHLKKEQHL